MKTLQKTKYRSGIVKLPYKLFFIVMFCGITSCHVGRYFYWNYAGINDYKKFPSEEIQKGSTDYSFPESNENVRIKLHEFFKEDNIKTFDDFLERKKTVAFMILRNDSIIFEKYFDGYDRQSILPSFSIAKSYVSSLIAIATEEGNIQSIDQPVTDFLTEFKHPGFSKITIRDLLNMQSGIKFNEGYYNPFGEMAKFYYGQNLKKYVLNLKTECEPGKEYKYQSCNTQILAMILEKATGKSLPEYLEEKIWKKTPMNYDASWNLDSKKHRNPKAFCCLNARLTDFALFGQLILKNGNWQGKQIIPEEWLLEIKNAKPGFTDAAGYPYYRHWRTLENGTLFAKGILGQYIYIDTLSNTVILRFGKKSADVDWPLLFKEVIQQL